jgi:hypothetical protein
MSRVLVATKIAPGPYPSAGVDVSAFVAADASNFNYFLSTGRELLIAQNTDTNPHTVTVHSQADNFGRTGDITAESIAAGHFHIFGPFAKSYWADSTGNINIDASDATVKFLVIQLP